MSETKFDMPQDHCPHCHHPIDHVFAVSADNDESPAPQVGSHTICQECGNISLLTESLLRRKLTEEEYAAIPDAGRAVLEEMKEKLLAMNRQDPTKTYLGDSVYAAFDGYHLVLTTDNGNGPTNTIMLEPTVVAALGKYVNRVYPKKEPGD